MKKHLPLLMLFLCFLSPLGFASESGIRERTSFNKDWQMLKGDYSIDNISGAAADLWENVRLPHDWAISRGPEKGKSMKNYGHYPLPGTYWYRKSFELPDADKHKRVVLEFEGVMQDSTVYLNGRQVGRWPNGYNSFEADLTPAIKVGKGQVNELLVHLDLPKKFTRWYSGAGIYRDVWMVKTEPLHFTRGGIFITTPEVEKGHAVVKIETEVFNGRAQDAGGVIEASILGQDGEVVASGEVPVKLPQGTSGTATQQLKVLNPQRWDIETPTLYQVVTRIKLGDAVVDEVVTPMGIRTLRFDAEKGFFLNDRHVKIYGVCNHHDLGPLGASFNLRAAERQLEILREMGCNAIRTSHNPPAPACWTCATGWVSWCMNELFDMWKIPKGEHNEGYTPKYWDEWWRKDVETFVKRDRNHPSIILWSSGNELPEQKEKDGAKLCREITDEFHKHDPTRLVTAGFNDNPLAVKNGLVNAVDVVGWNYATKYGDWYNDFRKQPEYKDKPQIATETVSAQSSRGFYRFPYGNPFQNGPGEAGLLLWHAGTGLRPGAGHGIDVAGHQPFPRGGVRLDRLRLHRRALALSR